MGDTSALLQLIAAGALAVLAFLLAYFVSPRTVVPWIICLSPFQLIDTRYGSSSIALTYVVGIAYILQGRLRYLPMFGIFVVILAIYMASTGLQHRATYIQHGLYIFSWVSTIVLFYIVYNFIRETKDVELVIRTLIILNVLVAAYSIIQITLGKQALFGLDQLSMKGARSRGDEPRLSGPYGVGVTAELLVIHILLCAYLLIHAKKAAKRYFLYLLIAVNLGCLLATANRGGFLVLIGGSGLFLYMYRSQLGVKRTLSLSFTGAILLAVMSVIIINFTDYGVMFQRLEATEIEGGIPDTRANTWATVTSKIPDKPLLGHGPRLRLENDYNVNYPGHVVITYPHNLYLFLLFTVGIIGLTAYLGFFAWLIVRIKRGTDRLKDDPFMHGFVRLGLLLMVVFLIDQMKIDFLRYALVDYWHYIFIIFAIWLGFADTARYDAARSDNSGSHPRDPS